MGVGLLELALPSRGYPLPVVSSVPNFINLAGLGRLIASRTRAIKLQCPARSQEVRTWRNVGIGFAVSFFALTLTLLSFGTNAYRQVSDLAKQVNELNSNLRDDLKDLQASQEENRVTKEKILKKAKEIQLLETKPTLGTKANNPGAVSQSHDDK